MLKLIARHAYQQGRADQKAADVAFLYEQADIHRGRPSDAKRRGAIHYAADQIRDGHGVGRPPEQQQTALDAETDAEREPRPLGWTFAADGRPADV